MTVHEYIQNNIEFTVVDGGTKADGVFELPKPYSVPTVSKIFRALFYWDTYFTNLALIKLGDIEQSKNNAENFAHLINTLGFIPNANRESLSDRSQPPFFSLMVRDIFNVTGDRDWLKKIYPALCQEHSFWVDQRSTDIGLAHYGTTVSPRNEEMYARRFAERIGAEYASEKKELFASNYLAQAESGWDFNARFDFESVDYCPADLNSLLWALEDSLASFAGVLKNGEQSKWRALADKRAEIMRGFLKNDSGVFCDRNSVSGRFSPYVSMSSLYPLFVGLADKDEAEATVRNVLPKLLFKWGVVPVEQIVGGYNYQWGAPNGWPCMQVIAAVGLNNYGYTDEACNVARSYVEMIESVFESTGALWEKYNVDSGDGDVKNEYEMPKMLGWTAGAYLYLKSEFMK